MIDETIHICITLNGKNVTVTGKPEYETFVNYWMRVTWTGIGFHDATWQSAFGGTRNQIYGVGSHGCINMPLNQAGNLYNMIEVGTPVIIHYYINGGCNLIFRELLHTIQIIANINNI